jgi:hypothetical protein
MPSVWQHTSFISAKPFIPPCSYKIITFVSQESGNKAPKPKAFPNSAHCHPNSPNRLRAHIPFAARKKQNTIGIFQFLRNLMREWAAYKGSKDYPWAKFILQNKPNSTLTQMANTVEKQEIIRHFSLVYRLQNIYLGKREFESKLIRYLPPIINRGFAPHQII